MSDHTLLGTDDAMTWAQEFVRIFNGFVIRPEDVEYTDNLGTVDEGTMVGWFANAMMTGITLSKQREIHAAGGLTDVEEFIERWEEDHPEDEIEDDMERRILEDQFAEGFGEGRIDPLDHIDPYGDTP